MLRQVGYVQGMGFLAGLMLLVIREEEMAFWSMAALLRGHRHAPLEGLFHQGLPLLMQSLAQLKMLIAMELPKLSRHFDR